MNEDWDDWLPNYYILADTPNKKLELLGVWIKEFSSTVDELVTFTNNLEIRINEISSILKHKEMNQSKFAGGEKL